MFICPNCQNRLDRTAGDFGVFWKCPACHGCAISLYQLEKTAPRKFLNQLWQKARGQSGSGGRPCPACEKPMAGVPVDLETTGLTLDACVTCHFVWFDPSEREHVPALPPPAAKEDIPQKARELMAVHRVMEAVKEREKSQSWEGPPERWKTVLGFLGFPVESNAPALHSYPWATWALAAVISLASLWAFSNFDRALKYFALVPSHTSRHGGLALLTSFFLHGGPLHLLGNLYFLLIFGDNVENYLGRIRFLALTLLATVAGGILHVVFSTRPDIPCIGASGGISGIILFYALQFPSAKIGYLIRLGFFKYFRWIRIPVYGYVGIWVLFQFAGVLGGEGRVSHLAHLGGAGTGLLFWLAMRMTGASSEEENLRPTA